MVMVDFTINNTKGELREMINNDIFQAFNDEILLINEWNQLNSSLIAGFTTKNGGYSQTPYKTFNLGLHVHDKEEDVRKNRRKLADLVKFPTSHWVCADQVHQNKITKVYSNDRGKGAINYSDSIPKTDGLYTTDHNVLLTSCYADCVPLYFFVPSKSIIGLAHAGWKGTVNKIAEKMVQALVDKERINIEDLLVCIGPAIHNCCYVVDKKVIEEINKMELMDANFCYSQISENQFKLNLSELNKRLLLSNGVRNENILVSSLCTSCEEELFFSHRRDHGSTGRMMSFIGLREE
jgi:polyphenol oxidase